MKEEKFKPSRTPFEAITLKNPYAWEAQGEQGEQGAQGIRGNPNIIEGELKVRQEPGKGLYQQIRDGVIITYNSGLDPVPVVVNPPEELPLPLDEDLFDSVDEDLFDGDEEDGSKVRATGQPKRRLARVRDLVKVAYPDGSVRPMGLTVFNNMVSNAPGENFYTAENLVGLTFLTPSGSIVRVENGRWDFHDDDKNLYDRINVNSPNHNSDIEENKERDETIEVNAEILKNWTCLSFNDIICRYFYPQYHSLGGKFSTDINTELVKCAYLNPEEFDEIFSVQKDIPESPLLKRYLKILSGKVNTHLDSDKELTDEVISEFEKQSHKEAGYQGKSLEQVKNEALDYQGYFRFLMTKNDNLIITEEQKEYFDNIFKNLKMDGEHEFRGYRRNKEIISLIPGTTGFYLKDTIPLLNKGSEARTNIISFHYVDDMNEINSFLKSQKFRLQIGYFNYLLVNCKNININYSKRMIFSIVFLDKFFNRVLLEVKSGTLDVCTKELTEVVKNVILTGTTKGCERPLSMKNVNKI